MVLHFERCWQSVFLYFFSHRTRGGGAFLSVSTVTRPPFLLLHTHTYSHKQLCAHMQDAVACANKRVATEWYFTGSVFVAGYFDPGWSPMKDF